MLAKITIENFFSFGEPTTIELNPGVNILVGINGSGKTNFIRAIQLLYESIVGGGFENLFINHWKGYNSVVNFSKSEIKHIRLSFEFDRDVVNAISLRDDYHFKSNPIYEMAIFPYGHEYNIEERCYVENANGDGNSFSFLEVKRGFKRISKRDQMGKISFQTVNLDSSIAFEKTEPILRQIADPISYQPLFTIKKAIQNLSIYSSFDTSQSSKIRLPKTSGTDQKLLPTGENLVTTFLKMQSNHSIVFDMIEEYLTNVNPNYKSITFNQLGTQNVLVLREKNLARSISVEHISEGTLQYLLLLAIFFNPDRGNLICIDEPEKGLHPDMIHSIASAIKQATNSQLIIATHSPLLLNAFDLDDLVIFEKDQDNQSIRKSLDSNDYEEWTEKYLVGQLWLNGQIGGKRW
jgi:predicted ATPase